MSQTQQPSTSSSTADLPRVLGGSHAIAIVVGTIIGSGIFLVPTEMMVAVGSSGLVYLAWIVGGLLSLFGAMTYAELGSMLPYAGGEYVYLRGAYGDRTGFLYMWTWFAVAKPASVASVTVALARTLVFFAALRWLDTVAIGSGHFAVMWSQIFAIAVTWLITGLNYLGIKKAGDFQVVFTALKAVLILVVVGFCFGSPLGSWGNFTTSVNPAPGGLTGFMIALIATLWAYDGWNDLTMVAGEVKNPEKNLPFALIGGLFVVGALFMATNAAMQYILRAKLIGTAAVVIAFAAGLWIGSEWAPLGVSKMSATAPKSDLAKSSDPVIAFWAKYIGNDPTPVIAYPDAVFLLDNYNDLFRFKQGATDYRGAPVDSHVAEQFASNPALVARAGQLYYENSYLGFGELKAVGMLSNVFGQMGYKPIVKPSRELTVDDLTQHNVIMLGSSSQNIAVAHFSNLGDFSFEDFDSRLEQWRGIIVNTRPRPNEASTYRTERDPNTRVLNADYSLITIQPGIVPGRFIADFGGLDTTGSEGAIFYATSRSGVDELTKAIQSQGNSGDKRSFPVFQALLKVRLEKGYHVVGISLVAVHMLPSTRPETRDAGTAKALQP